MFKKTDFTTVRDHAEFLWLHDRFVEDEEYAGIIVSTHTGRHAPLTTPTHSHRFLLLHQNQILMSPDTNWPSLEKVRLTCVVLQIT